jgi:hypothetical protein
MPEGPENTDVAFDLIKEIQDSNTNQDVSAEELESRAFIRSRVNFGSAIAGLRKLVDLNQSLVIPDRTEIPPPIFKNHFVKIDDSIPSHVYSKPFVTVPGSISTYLTTVGDFIFEFTEDKKGNSRMGELGRALQRITDSFAFVSSKTYEQLVVYLQSEVKAGRTAEGSFLRPIDALIALAKSWTFTVELCFVRIKKGNVTYNYSSEVRRVVDRIFTSERSGPVDRQILYVSDSGITDAFEVDIVFGVSGPTIPTITGFMYQGVPQSFSSSFQSAKPYYTFYGYVNEDRVPISSWVAIVDSVSSSALTQGTVANVRLYNGLAASPNAGGYNIVLNEPSVTSYDLAGYSPIIMRDGGSELLYIIFQPIDTISASSYQIGMPIFKIIDVPLVPLNTSNDSTLRQISNEVGRSSLFGVAADNVLDMFPFISTFYLRFLVKVMGRLDRTMRLAGKALNDDRSPSYDTLIDFGDGSLPDHLPRNPDIALGFWKARVTAAFALSLSPQIALG